MFLTTQTQKAVAGTRTHHEEHVITEQLRHAAPATAGVRRAPSSIDVANLAGVSQKTVSRVFNDERYVSTAVRERVLHAARQLGYRRNGAARALSSGRSRALGAVFVGRVLGGSADHLLGLGHAARAAGYSLRVVNLLDADPTELAAAVDALLEDGAEAIILSEPISLGSAPIVVNRPVLVLGNAPGLVGHPVVTLGGSEADAAALATRHLLDLGHRTVHHVAGPQHWYSAQERVEGWRTALAERGAVQPPYLEGDWFSQSGYDAGRVLAQDPDVTAVFAANDDMAIGALRAFREAGRRVPGDISIVGFDDIPVAPFVDPPLTTVYVPQEDLAAAALAVLLRAMEDPELTDLVGPTVTSRLIVRRSTGPAAGTTPAPVAPGSTDAAHDAERGGRVPRF
jgi:DNA-binding LacI/PurR family transcriptional regulator